MGLLPDVDKERFLKAIETQQLEDCFQHWLVQAGDTFFLPAGTPHTITPGLVFCEIQEYSDLTYRISDFGRVDSHGKQRELHIQKALDVIQFGPRSGGKVSRLARPGPGARKSLLAACRYFATERWEVLSSVETHADAEHFTLFVILFGNGIFAWGGGEAKYQRGECWLIPAALGRFTLRPEEPTVLLHSYVPDLAALRAELKLEGHAEAEIAKTVFA